MTQRLESIKACKCGQCGDWFYYKRVTAKYCSETCRQRAKRGIEPSDKFKYDLQDEYDTLAFMISEINPKAFRLLETMKRDIGVHAVKATLEIIKTLDLVKD